MKKGGGVSGRYENKERKIDAVTNKKKMKRNMQRLGGKGGLSLETFANAKTRNDNYNPSLIKKQREFYKNAKCVRKYKKSINQQEQQKIPSTAERLLVGVNETNEGEVTNQKIKNKNRNKKNVRNLEELYTKKHEEQERARIEREAMIQAKKEEREVAEARRRALKEKMYKKTRSGQPVMKYRIEHLLESIQGQAS